MTDVARQITIGQRYTVRGIDAYGRMVSEDVLLVDKPVFTKTKFRYVGPWWWCRWHQARSWARNLFR